MKSKANFILFFVWINCFAQDQNTSTPVNPALLREIISQGHLANNLIYTYSDWCAPCVKEFPRVIDFCKTNNVGLYIIVLSKEGNADLSKLEAKFEKKYSLVSPNLFNFKYDKQYLNLKTKNNFKNYQAVFFFKFCFQFA